MTNLCLQIQLREINGFNYTVRLREINGTNLTIPFGIRFSGMPDYIDSECAAFIECADSLNDDELIHRYREFLTLFAEGQIKPSTQVATDIMEIFYDDVYNRASIDYLEGHYPDEPEIWKGGRYFYERSLKLRAHIDQALAVYPIDNTKKEG